MLTFDKREGDIVKKDSAFGLHQKVAGAIVELWMSVTHAGDVFWCVGKEYFFVRG